VNFTLLCIYRCIYTQAEPSNRLATLRFLEGDYEDSAQLCLRVLRAKPWHFGASSGIVMVYASMGNADEASRWARQAMPSPGPERQVENERKRASEQERERERACARARERRSVCVCVFAEGGADAQ
jgi:hypothetical protein